MVLSIVVRTHRLAAPQSLFGSCVASMALEVPLVGDKIEIIPGLDEVVFANVHIARNFGAVQPYHLLQFPVPVVIVVHAGTRVIVAAPEKHVFEAHKEQQEACSSSYAFRLLYARLISAY